ncbi:hypothetical protein [Scytonema sp. NUACC21]
MMTMLLNYNNERGSGRIHQRRSVSSGTWEHNGVAWVVTISEAV